MRREILKRGRATACCKKFAKQSSLRYTKFYKAQAATVRADLQNQGAEEAAADTARRIYAAVAAGSSGEISSRRASPQHIIARSARIVSARYRAAPYVSSAIYALRAVSCDIDRVAVVSRRDTAVASVSRRTSLARCAGRTVKIVRAGRPVCASAAKF